MSKYVVFNSMMEDGIAGTTRVLTEDAIRQQKEVAYYHNNFVYETDEQALDDFLICNWGWIEEQDD
jgi:hypothetical protein